MNCKTCEGTGWVVGDSGARRCPECQKKRTETAAKGSLDKGSVASAVHGLSALAYFPTDPMAQTVIGDALAAMCPSVDALRHVVRRATELYRSWDKCGVPGLRQIVCSKFRPADGIESGPTDQFPEGLRSETGRNPLALPAGAVRALPSGRVDTSDRQLESNLQALARSKDMNRHAPPTAPPISPQRRAELQAQIDRAVQENRDKKAREELGV